MYLKKISILLLSILFISGIISGQQEVLLTIGAKKISTSEFKDYCNQNFPGDLLKNKDSAKEALKQFTDYTLKILEAKNLGLDNSQTFQKKLEIFKNQITKKNIVDKELLNAVTQQTYQRMKTEIRASQILVKILPNSLPKDTALAFQKALKVQRRLINGEAFDKVARQVSDDPQAAYDGGDLWFTLPFMLPMQVEDYLYSHTQEKYSNPIRSSKGYHIIQFVEKRENPGSFKFSHILIAFSGNKADSAQIKFKIDSIYNLLLSGQDFSALANRYSDDKGSGANGGELPWVVTGMLPHEFEMAAFSLTKDGEFSKPFLSRFGWHIVKRLAHKDFPDYLQIKSQLEDKILASERGEILLQNSMEDLKKKYGYTDNYDISQIKQFVDSTIYAGDWKIPDGVDFSAMLFSFSNQNFTEEEFLKYLEGNQITGQAIQIEPFLYQVFTKFVNEKLLKYEGLMLEKNNKQYNQILNNYKDGLLFNEITAIEINQKIENEAELEKYYSKNYSKYNNLVTANVSVFKYGTEDKDKIEKQFRKYKGVGMSDEEIESRIKQLYDPDFHFIERINKISGSNPEFDRYLQLKKNGQIADNERLVIFKDSQKILWLNTEVKNFEKPYEEIKNQVKVDYSAEIEKKWIDGLRYKYKVNVNESVFNAMF
ncbi:MAG: peptidylprolyl isomerase [Bacteroidales bacterium]